MAVFLAVQTLLMVTEPLQVHAVTKPSITKQPAGKQVLQGKTVSSQVTAKGGSLKYQWYMRLPGGSWKKLMVSSAKKAALKLTAREVYDGASIRCKVTNSRGTVYSKTVKLTVITFTKKTIKLNPNWKYANGSVIHSGSAVLYSAKKDRKEIVIGVNAGHGTKGGSDVKTWCHPDHTAKVTGGTTARGETKAYAVSSGMTFRDGTPEAKITLKVAQYLKELLLTEGYDVLVLRDGADVQLDNVARTVICNNRADCHIAIHFDDDGYRYDKGAFFLSVPNALKRMAPVSSHWREHEAFTVYSRSKTRTCKQ